MISLHACPSYEEQNVASALDACLQDLGGWEAFVAPGETVLLKVNLVSAMDPATGATAHPAVVAEVARKLLALGCRVLIGDSPGGTFNEAHLKRVYRVCGMEDAARDSGAELCCNTAVKEIENPDGKLLKRLTITDMVASADKVISISKIKTHAMMTYTGVTKNMFGAIPGTEKPELHMRMPGARDFADALLDIWQATKPVLSLMDGVLGMEGNGPTGGEPRAIGLIGASPDAPALDLVCAHIIGLGAEDVPLLRQARERGWIPADSREVETKGDDPESFVISDFKMPDHIAADLVNSVIPKGLRAVSRKALRPKVQFNPAVCVGCGECAADCPAKAITMVTDKKTGKRHPVADYNVCIRCYCCQELCPRHAVSIRQSVLFRLANKL